jgi:hypothetical protein
MKKASKGLIMIVLTIVLILFNLGHIYWPITLIIEDIKMGTMVGTNIELSALYCWILEFFSLPFILINGVFLFMFKKEGKVSKVNVISWFIYILQIILFNVLLFI